MDLKCVETDLGYHCELMSDIVKSEPRLPMNVPETVFCDFVNSSPSSHDHDIVFVSFYHVFIHNRHCLNQHHVRHQISIPYLSHDEVLQEYQMVLSILSRDLPLH